jgi:hypothetical protein
MSKIPLPHVLIRQKLNPNSPAPAEGEVKLPHARAPMAGGVKLAPARLHRSDWTRACLCSPGARLNFSALRCPRAPCCSTALQLGLRHALQPRCDRLHGGGVRRQGRRRQWWACRSVCKAFRRPRSGGLVLPQQWYGSQYTKAGALFFRYWIMNPASTSEDVHSQLLQRTKELPQKGKNKAVMGNKPRLR